MSVLLRLNNAVMKHSDQDSMGRKGFTWFMLLCYCSLLKEVRTGAQIGKELGGRS